MEVHPISIANPKIIIRGLTKALLCLLLVAVIFERGSAQELNISVNVDFSQINTTSIDYLDELRPLVESYLNEFRWTKDNFEEIERIRGNIQIFLSSIDNNGNVQARMAISIQRPIYGTTQQTTVLNLVDETVGFNFARNTNLIHDPLIYEPLATLLDFYAYYILGVDYDSFALLGGSAHFEQAQQILNIAQSSGGAGWSRNNVGSNRYALLFETIDPQYAPLREFTYHYHRKSLDRFLRNPDEARETALTQLKIVRNTQRRTTETGPFVRLFDTKFKEFVSVFEDAEAAVKVEAYQVLSEVDPSHMTAYQALQ